MLFCYRYVALGRRFNGRGVSSIKVLIERTKVRPRVTLRPLLRVRLSAMLQTALSDWFTKFDTTLMRDINATERHDRRSPSPEPVVIRRTTRPYMSQQHETSPKPDSVAG